MARTLAAAAIVAGTGLRLWQYLGNPSLWLDEAFLANSILEQPLGDLLAGPLYYGQVAPKGFLLVQWVAVWVCGRSDLALRLVPVACSVAALPVLWLGARRILSSRAAIVAVALLALSPGATFYVQAKQYSADTLVSGLTLLAGLELLEARRVWLWTFVGAALAWFSQPVAFVMCGGALVLWWNDRRRLDVVVIWGASAVLAGLVSFASLAPGSRPEILAFWAHGWIPYDLVAGPVWAAKLCASLFAPGALWFRAPIGCAFAAVWGAVVLMRLGTRGAMVLAVVPVVLVASAARVYPLADRLLCFLMPQAVILVAAAADDLAVRMRTPTAAGLAVLPALLAIATVHPVRRVEDIRPALSYLASEARAGDALYVYYATEPAFRRYRSEIALPVTRVILGRSLREGAAPDTLEAAGNSSRVWTLFTHERAPEMAALLAELDRSGPRKRELEFGGESPARVYLHDFTVTGSRQRSAPLP